MSESGTGGVAQLPVWKLFMNGKPSFALVIPFFNEEKNVGIVCGELRSLLESQLADSEVVLVDDGSSDQTGAKLDEIARNWPACRVFHFKKNQGQSAALLFGFSKTNAPVLVTMDGDGQNDANDIPKLLGRLREADMVVGARINRQDSWVRRKISRIANLVRSSALGDGVSDSGCALKVFRREVVGAFIPIKTLYSFMPALAVAAGFRVVEQPVNHRPRAHGDSRYSVRSFLLLPIVDFIGLKWFRSRRCQVPPHPRPNEYPAIGTLGDELYRPASRRGARSAAFIMILTLVPVAILRPWNSADGTAPRKISLHRAERIAFQHVPKGQFGDEELHMTNGRLAWTIDVQPPDQSDLHEIDIDAVDGKVLAVRTETAEEEALEAAVEGHDLAPRHP
jgi:Glycosyl transferase family 2/Peptidase propeptide and YPEB domain